MPANAPKTEPTERPGGDWFVLVAIAAMFLVVRVPLMFRQAGGQDEDYYAVPGWTILQDGVPRIPYVPSRDPDGVFYRADEVLFALPPLYFYWQAVVYAVTGPGYGAGRLASGLAGLLAVAMVYWFGKRWYGQNAIALWAAGLFSLSRIFFFPATFARPDMLCAAIALAAVWALWHWHLNGRRRWLAVSGSLAGLAMLTHPFALVPCLQLGVGVLCFGRGLRGKSIDAAVWTTCSLLAFAMWLLLIWGHEEVFRIQFVNNVVGRSGPGLLHRFLMPWESIAAQFRLLFEHAGGLQAALMTGGLIAATLLDFRNRETGKRFNLALAWSGVYLLVICQGTHPAKGYWCYPGAFVFLCVARSMHALCKGLHARAGRWSKPIVFGVCLTAIGLILPGSGLRAWWTHMRHWNDVAYNQRAFVDRLLAKLPEDADYLVDVSYVLNFHLAGRKPTLALNIPPYFEAQGREYDYLIVGPTGLEQRLPDQLGGHLLSAYGIPGNPFACYAEVYVPVTRSAKKRSTGN